ncbi:MAG: DNA-protecting protein DprA, partial [Anaerolineae bacterium]|nr:DNA-protecting protein DprA [Anaerolineae bacterium]
DPDPPPLTSREWHALLRKIQASPLKHPGAVLGLVASDLQAHLEIGPAETGRLARLMERSGTLALELERLASFGIQVLTHADEDYPARYRQRLQESAPALLFYTGEKELLGQPGIAVVGSRHLDEAGRACAELVGNACGISGLILYSGGAKGVDTISMNAALQARGSAVGILADSLEKAIRDPATRAALKQRDLCLATPYSPNAPFSVGMAMGRNRLIYALADYAIVVASDAEKGGTWAGATETLKAKWVPVFVLDHPAMPEGNRLLLQKGGLRFPHPFPEHPSQLQAWLAAQAAQVKPEPFQPKLF